MNFLLDTNVVSEWAKPRPDAGVVAWLAEADEDRIFISVITIAELRYGIERLPAGARRNRLDAWLKEQVPQRFEERLLAVDADTALHILGDNASWMEAKILGNVKVRI